MPKIYTKGDLRKFDRLTAMLHSPSQMERIHGRMEIKKFIELHGQEKCDAMFEVLKARDAKTR
jgi:hypothetical protein